MTFFVKFWTLMTLFWLKSVEQEMEFSRAAATR